MDTHQVFAPLVTQASVLPAEWGFLEEAAAVRPDLPRGLGGLARAGATLRRSLLASVVLGLVSLSELVVLLVYPEPTPLVVWEERLVRPLVEGP